MEVLEGVPSLDSMEMEDRTMETVPEYVTTVTPRYFKLTCSEKLYKSLLTGSSSCEYHKISHIKSCTIDYFSQKMKINCCTAINNNKAFICCTAISKINH